MANRVGILIEAEHGGIVETTGKNRIPPIVIPQGDLNGAPFGMKVVVELTTPEDGPEPRGRVIEVLGDPMRPDVAILGIIRDHGLKTDFPRGVQTAANRIPQELTDEVLEEELARGRRDLRSLRTLTIDGKDAKDLDDAISIQELSDGSFRLWVHIADVTHYVKEGSVLDKEALERGTPVYLVDRVLPMLPARLSNGICSLNPKVDRLTLTCMMTISATGAITDSEIFESVIHSDLRANYVDVFAALESDQIDPDYVPFLPDLRAMQRCARIISQHRSQQGNLEFAFPETHVDLDPDGKPLAIYAYPINEANGIIEEFMIAANRAVAKTFADKNAPFIYRVHENPDPEKMERFVRMARLLNVRVNFRGRVPSTQQLGEILEKVKATPYEAMLSQLLLQSLAKARYSEQNLGHYGLGLNYYCHFTSPIRRYPDLFIHRVIKGYLHGEQKERKWRKAAPEVSEHTSDAEREAMYAEYDTIDQKVAEYMSERLGERYMARISGMIEAGVFVSLETTVEGMIPYRTMNDYFSFDPDTLTARGERSGRVLKIGDEVEVVVARADLIRRQVDFMFPEDWERNQSKINRDERTEENRGASSGSRKKFQDKKGQGSGRKSSSERRSQRSGQGSQSRHSKPQGKARKKRK